VGICYPHAMERNEVSVGYDAVYDATPRSPTLRRLWSELAAETDYPEAFLHISFVTLAELQRIANALNLLPSKTVVDLGCGRGGPALWVARETGAQLIGVDFSPAAVVQAATRAAVLGLTDQTRFVVGTFDHTGLESHSADAAMSEDALQYAPNKRAALVEAARILRPGARLVFTAFELDPDRAAGLPVIGADPADDYRPLLEEAGFTIDTYEDVLGWPEPMTRTYQALLNARDTLIEEMGAPAATALFMELTVTLQQQPYRRRIRAHATR
jgi:SAM-dependent methyltransferase